MAIIVYSKNAQDLLNKIVEKFNKSENKDIKTWDITNVNGSYYFTHNPEQWNKKTFFKAYIKDNNLVFGIVTKEALPISIYLYGIYHGRFIELLLNHFDMHFDNANVISLLSDYDIYR